MKKILILGAKGSLGGQLVKVFSAGYEVIGWDREEIDITDDELARRKINEIKPAIIINAAAYNAVDKCEEPEEFGKAEKLNGLAVGYLAEGAMESGAVLVHYSSDYVFAGDRKTGYRENDQPDPINNYGRSKFMGEKELIKRSGGGLKWYLIRTSKLFGPRGESEATKPSFFDLMIKLSGEKEELEAVDEEMSRFTYTPDLALWTKKLTASDSGYGIYHFTNEGAATWYQGAFELFSLIGKKITVKPVTGDRFPRSAKRPKFSVLLNTKFEKMRDWKSALKEYLESKK